MKKPIYFLLTLLLLNLCNCYGVFGGTLDKNIGVTNFLFDSNNFDKVSQFKVQRYFVDNFRVTKDSTLAFWTQPTWQNFKHDDVLKNAKDNGVFNIWCTQGKMPHHVVQGKANKVNPIRDSDSPQDLKAWSDYGRLVKQIALRYANDSQPYLSQARVYQSSNYQNNIPKAGLGLVDAMEYTNEFDFLMSWSGATRTFTPEDGAVGFKVFIDSIRSVSKTMQIIMGGTIQPKVETFHRFITKLKSLYAAEGKEMPTDWYLNFHWYMRNGSNNQGAGTWGISPETAKAYRFGLQMDSLCRVHKLLGWRCTETGWSTYATGTNVSLAKQNAPVMQGYDIYHSQGLCMVRLALIWGATQYCQDISFWNRKDNDDVGAYQNGGVNYSNWQPKYCQTILSEYLTHYRYHSISNFRQKDQLYAVDLIASADTTTLVWTDLNKFGEYDAKPRIGKLTTPNQSPVINLTSPVDARVYTSPATVVLSVNASDSDGNVTRVEFKQNGNLIFTDTQYPYTHTVTNLPTGTYTFSITAFDNSNLFSTIANIGIEVNPATTTGLKVLNHTLTLDGTPFKIRGHNSPENILHWLNYPFLDWLYTHGANSIYASVNNKESGKPQLSVWVNNNPANGFDEAKVNAWVAYAQYWLAKDSRNVVQIVLFEKETLNLWALQDQKNMITYLSQKFAAFNGRILINTEEADNGWSRLNALYDHLKTVAPTWLRALHCNTGQNCWNGNYNTDRVQVLSFQDNISAFHNHINTEVPKNQHWVAIASEMTGGFQPNDVAKAETLWNAGGSYNVGVEVYIACCDQTNPATNWYQQYAPVFDKLKSLADGTVVPPDTTTTQYTLNYATNSTKQPNNTLQGASLSAGKIWVFVDVNTDIPNRPLKFYYDNVYVNPENSLPYDLGGGNGYNVTDGQHTVRVDNSQGTTISQATFTVGTIVLPPDTIIPPDTTNIVVEYSVDFSLNPSTPLVNGARLPIGGMWLGVKTGTGVHTFSLKRGTSNPENFTDNSAPFQFKANWLQAGSYTLTINNGSVNKIITFVVN